ncbi:MAG TPA: hypothetical protein VM263_03215, partial [Acidimicrobiales bacterium]|nr:hypothetical protein [Acidimicrobiales bacterium]
MVVALGIGLPPGASAATRPPTKAQLAEAQKRANAAAGRLAKARAGLTRAEREIADLEARTARTEQVVGALEGQVRQLAVAQYVLGGRSGTWLGGADPGEVARRRALLRFVSLGRTDSVDGYRVARSDLEAGQAALTEQLDRQRAVVSTLRKEEATVSAELARLAAAQKAYEAQVAAQKAAAARKAAARRTASAVGRASRGAVLPVDVGPVPILGSGSWICPVQGPRAFTDDFGDPRSGGRRHQGNDIMAPRGTPVVASVAGTVKGHNSGLGGISYYLRGDDGNTYFGTHLDRLSA